VERVALNALANECRFTPDLIYVNQKYCAFCDSNCHRLQRSRSTFGKLEGDKGTLADACSWRLPERHSGEFQTIPILVDAIAGSRVAVAELGS
jgi:hypothetical protein